MRRLKFFKFVHQRVVFGVADLGLVEHVVEMLVTANFFAQLFDLAYDIALGSRLAHSENYSQRSWRTRWDSVLPSPVPKSEGPGAPFLL